MSSDYEIELSVSDFVAVTNQTLEYAYPSVVIVGELANVRISKNRWVYFDLKDEFASVKFFGTVYQLKTPLEEGMLLKVRGAPRLHPQFGFSVTVQQIALVGEGTIKRAAALLEKKLEIEGLFDPSRKRLLPYPPRRIGLVTSGESAAYSDFMKILQSRWVGLEIIHADVQVQGLDAPTQIVRAIEMFNQHELPVDVLVITRGGGSADDLQAFSAESVVRAVAGSRIPTLVAIGHERDFSLAERAADVRASTPSNAAELLTPDKTAELQNITQISRNISQLVTALYNRQQDSIVQAKLRLGQAIRKILTTATDENMAQRAILDALSPRAILARGYALVRQNGIVIRRGRQLLRGEVAELVMADARIIVRIEKLIQEEKK